MKNSIILLLIITLASCQLNKTNNTETPPQSNTSMPVATIPEPIPSIVGKLISTSYQERDMGVDQFGLPSKYKYFEVLAELKNNSTKATKKIIITVLFRQKNSDPDSRHAQQDRYDSEKEVEIMPNDKKIVTFTIFPKDDINMVYSSTTIQRVIYSDGTYEDL